MLQHLFLWLRCPSVHEMTPFEGQRREGGKEGGRGREVLPRLTLKLGEERVWQLTSLGFLEDGKQKGQGEAGAEKIRSPGRRVFQEKLMGIRDSPVTRRLGVSGLLARCHQHKPWHHEKSRCPGPVRRLRQ